MLKKNCIVCDVIYFPNSNNSKYCSDACRKVIRNKIRRNEIKQLKCPICSTLFETSNSKKMYCSNNCNEMAKKIRSAKPDLQKQCKYCSKNFIASGKSRNAIYCSKDCRKKHWQRNHVEKICPNCKNYFLADKRQTCCSKTCSINYTSKLITLKCEICSMEFHITPARIKNDVSPRFCSEPCYRESRRTGITPNCICDNCGKEKYKAPSLLKKHKYTFCSALCMGEYFEKHSLFSGKNNGAYIGSFDKHKKYYGPNWLQQRRFARKRDNYVCQKCGIHEIDYGMELSVHHLVPFVLFSDYEAANELDNLLSVCEPCHRKIHSGDNHHSKYHMSFKNLKIKPSN